MREWDAEVIVEADLARRLIGEQFPELGLRTIKLLGQGWDNTVWRVDDEWTFRFPRRSYAVLGSRTRWPSSPGWQALYRCRFRIRPSSGGRPRSSPGRSMGARSCRGASWPTRT